MPEISIVIPTLNRPEKLARTLAGVERACEGIDAEVLVVTDAAERNPTEVEALVAEKAPQGRRLSGPRPGASAARNIGWRNAQSGLILFLDDDVVPTAGLVAAHIAAHRAHPGGQTGILGHVRWAPDLKLTSLMRWVEHGILFDYPRIEGNDAGWGRLYTANVSLKRAALERVGGFDEERFPFGFEDIDLGYRLHRELDFQLRYERGAVGDHLHAMDLDQLHRRMRSVGTAERTFCCTHPEIEPYFHRLFSDAVSRAPARGRGRHLIGLVPRDFPVLGDYVWRSADLYFAQALAPSFFEAWDSATVE